MITETWNPFEANELARQKTVEAQALAMYKKDPATARQYLTHYSNDLGNESFQLVKQLLRDVKTKIYDEP